jgi:hypothetical protein
MSDVTDWATIVVTGGLGVAGFWVANSIKLRRRTELEVAAISRRWDAYERFFSATKPAAPIRDVSKGDDEEVLSESDREKLHDALATWWFDEGGGMLLGEPSRSIYFIAKGNLVCDDNALTPTSARNWIAGQSNRTIGRSELAIRQLSLLRSAMRADLGIIGRPYGKPLDDVDRDFLRSAGVKLWEPPWWTGRWRDWVVERLFAPRRH